MENVSSDEMSGIDPEDEDTVIVRFTKDPNNGRYGFLEKVY